MVKPIAIGVAVLLVIVLATVFAIAATKPDTFRVQRTASIKAPPEKIFGLINDFHQWGAWSPYEKLDPSMKKTYSGADSGAGSVYEWEGNSQAGAGRIEIQEASSPSKIGLSLDMRKPFECHNIVEFTLEPQGESTAVTWAMHGPNHTMSKVMQVFCNMDRMVGSQFDEGLANLKSVAEDRATDSNP